jgi:Ca2+-transporting ATPase
LVLLPVHIALLHLVIDPACTVVFEGMAGSPQLMVQPPRAADAPLLAPHTWHASLRQGALLTAVVLVASFWPDLALAERRSWVFALLLVGGGALVWWNGDRSSGLTRAGALIGVGLWLLVQAIPGLVNLLQLAPTPPAISLAVMAVAIALSLVAGRSSSPAAA